MMPNTAAPRGPVSNSAPPSFRARKKKPGDHGDESNPAPQNNGRLTGPPMQMGAGKGSMFADGRKGQPQGNMPRTPAMPMGGPGPMRPHGQPQFAAPKTPNYPKPAARPVHGQRQGAAPMMADGRKPIPDEEDDDMMANPAPMGGAPDDQDTVPDQDDMAGGPPEGTAAGETPVGDGMGGTTVIISPESVNFHDNPVKCELCTYMQPDGNCQVLQIQVGADSGCNAFQQKADDEGTIDTGAGFTQNPEGTSGVPALS